MLLGLPYLPKLAFYSNKARAPNKYTMATSTSPNFSTTLQKNAWKTNFPSCPGKKSLHTKLGFSFSMPFNKLICLKSFGIAKYDEVVVDEEMDKIRRLQNGSDVRGVALEGEKGRTVDLTPPAVEAIAESFGEWVINGLEKEQGHPVENVRVSLGRDPRISGAKLSVAVFAGLARAGCMVFDMGLATTPACFMSTILPPFIYDASIMVGYIKFQFFLGSLIPFIGILVDKVALIVPLETELKIPKLITCITDTLKVCYILELISKTNSKEELKF